MVRAGEAFNIIPQSVGLTGTIRTLSEKVREKTHARLRAIAEGTAALFGASRRGRLRGRRAGHRQRCREDRVRHRAWRARSSAATTSGDMRPIMGAEDFSHMLRKRPGAFIMIGNGVGPGLHNPGYNFNDAAIPIGVSYWVRLAETAMPA